MFAPETPENYEQKCCCVLVLDVSGSMAGAPIQQMNDGIRQFHTEIQEDPTAANRLEIGVVEFAETVKVVQDPELAHNFTMPVLTTHGTTKLVDGVREGIRMMRARKAWYKQTSQKYYRPWVILITDGEPDSGQDVAGLAGEITAAVEAKEFHFFALGVDKANMQVLQQLSHSSMAPASLQGTKFVEFFKWLSASMGSAGITGSKDGATITMPDPGAWMKGFKV